MHPAHPSPKPGERVGHPPVDVLARGASPYDVAKLLGDTIETVEKHYAEFVRELRERVRRMMEDKSAGLLAFADTPFQPTEPIT